MKLKKVQLIMLVAYIINFLLIVLISTGLVSSSLVFKIYLFTGLSLVPILLQGINLYFVLKYKEDFENNKPYLLYLHDYSYMVLMLLVGIKMSIQLDSYVFTVVITSLVFFVALIVLNVLKYNSKRKEEITFKKYLTENILTILTYVVFMTVIIILTFDYSTII